MPGEHYTYADYEQWGDYVPRCELIDGIVYAMAAPSLAHQRVSRELLVQLHGFLRGRSCEVFNAPFDVRLNFDKADDIVVQPDILVVCDPEKLANQKNCLGAPDFIIEILSPSNSKHETIRKLTRYLEAAVKEYWVVDPEDKIVVAHRLIDKQYLITVYTEQDEAQVMILEGCTIKLSEVFV